MLSISLAHGFSAGDVPEVGFRVLVITDGDKAKAAALAERLGREVLAMGRAATPRHYKPEEAVALARAAKEWPQVFGDRWDSPGGGVPGDSTIMIETLLRHPDLPSAIGVMWDPIAVEFCRAAGVGGNLWLRIGGKATPVSGPSLDAHVVVKGVTDDLVIPFEQSMVSLGPAAAVSIGNVDIVHRQQACPDLQPARLHQSRDRPVQEGDRDREVVEPFLRRVLEDCGGDPLSRHRRSVSRTIRWRSPTSGCADRSHRWTQIHGHDRPGTAACRFRPAMARRSPRCPSMRSRRACRPRPARCVCDEIGQQGWNLFRGDIPLPAAVLRARPPGGQQRLDGAAS